uniref:CW domain-containing protein n=2 Tax=Caenorhabditis tropicalis TaxID=1561998 RepID=A0A1I7TBP4_9PELO
MKLIEFYGKVTDDSSVGNVTEGCVRVCYFMDSCILISFGDVCRIHSYLDNPNTLSVVRTWSGSTVYFKVNLPKDSCPANSSSLNMTFTSATTDSYTWISTSDGWSFPGCPDDWNRFDRSNGISVCMKSIAFPTPQTREYAISTCNEINSVLVGVDSVAEVQWMRSRFLLCNLLSESYSDELIHRYDTDTGKYLFWIDGQHNCTGAERCDNYAWTDGFTTGNSAITEKTAFISYTREYSSNFV